MILVTGATGFFGRRVCRRLEQNGSTFTRTSFSLGTDLRDYDQTLALFQSVRPHTVVNCASSPAEFSSGSNIPPIFSATIC